MTRKRKITPATSNLFCFAVNMAAKLRQ